MGQAFRRPAKRKPTNIEQFLFGERLGNQCLQHGIDVVLSRSAEL